MYLNYAQSALTNRGGADYMALRFFNYKRIRFEVATIRLGCPVAVV